MINHFTFNGTSTAQLGLIVSGVSIFGAGSRKVEKAGIPGRNGDLQIELGGFNNYTVRYTVSITKNFTTTAQQIREWLLESKGYCDLTDTYHPDEIRKACFNSDIEFTTSMLYKYGQASIQFDCLPERYLTTNTPITTTATADTTTDTTLSLSTVPTPISISLNGNTTQEGTPSPTNPQVIHNVSGDNEITVVNKNLFDIENDYVNTKFSLSGGTLFNTATDTRTYFFLSILALNGNTVVSVIYANSFSTTGEKSVTFNSGDLSNVTRLRLKHNGSSNDLEIAYVEKSSLTANTSYTLSFNLISNNPTTVNGLIISNIQLEKGSTATTYEPYTRQSYPLYLPVENIFNSDKLLEANGWAENDGVYTGVNSALHTAFGPSTNGIYNSFQQGQQYTFSFDLRQDSTGFGALVIRFYYTDNTYDGKQIDGTSEWKRYTFTSTSTTKTLSKLILSYGNTIAIQLKNIQLEKGVNANTYNPYGNPYIELNKIGTYQDYIYKNGGKWYVHKAFNKITLDGSSDENVRKNVADTANYLYYWMGLPNIDATQLGYVYCDRLINTIVLDNINGGNGTVNVGCAMRSSSSQSVFYFNVGVYLSDNTLATVKTWLASNPLTFIYPLQTPTNTEITDTTLINQLNNIEKAYSYNGTTNILQVSNDNGFMLAVVSLHGTTFNSNYKGEPIITVNSTGLIYLNGEVMEVLSAPVTINCQTMQCYNGVVNMNNEVRVNDFPEIKIGENTVGSSMALTITPNNWRH